MAFDEEMQFREKSGGEPWLRRLARAGDPAVFLAPAPAARLLVLHLPMKSASARTRAAGFAAEPNLGEPVEAVHVAVGPALGEDRYLCAAVSHDVMASWIEDLGAAGVPNADLIPELCTLRKPEIGAWTAARDRGLVLVRTPDGAGFACSEDAFGALEPPALDDLSESVDPGAAFDLSVSLRTGPYARRSAAPRRAARFAAGLAAVTLIAAFALLLVEVAALNAVRSERLETARTRVEALYGDAAGAGVLADPVAVLERLAAGSRTGRPAVLSDLMTAVADALTEQDGAVSVLALDYRTQTLTLTVEANALTDLQGFQAELQAAGVPLDPGPVSQTDGRAEMQITITGGEAR